MNIPRLAIRNAPFTLTVFFLLTVFGVYAYLEMPRTENPSVYVPGGSIVVVYPGAGPRDMEQLVVLPLEESIHELDDIRRIESEIRNGIAIISVEFSYDTDAKEKYDELVRQVNSTRSRLAEGIVRMDIIEWTSSDVAIMQLAFYSDSLSYRLLQDEAEELKKMIERIPGVKKVELAADQKEEIRITPDPVKMAMMHISFNQLADVLKSNNANIPGGEMVIDGRRFNIQTSGSYHDLEEIRNTVVQSWKGRTIHLRDIAEVHLTCEDPEYLARYKGHRAVWLTVMQKDRYNIFDVEEKLVPLINDFRKALPEGIALAVVFDQSVWVEHRIGGFLSNLLQGIVLVSVVILLAMGLRSSLIVALAIPLSLVIGLGFLDLSGYGLQQVSIGALVVALGMLVDNSIVVTENINRLIREGKDAVTASEEGTVSIAWPVVTATLTTLLAFIPIAMMPEKAGDFIRSLPLTILYTLTASLLIALTLTPLVTSVMFRRTGRVRNGKNPFLNLLNSIIEGPYQRTLYYVLAHKGRVLILALVVFLASLALFPLIGVSFFPPAEMPDFMIRVRMPHNASLQETDRVVRYVESVLDTMPFVDRYAANIGHGNPRIYYNLFPKDYARDFGEIYVHLGSYDHKVYERTVEQLRQTFSGYPFARIHIKEYEQGVPVKSPVMIYVYGKNFDRLRKLAGEVERIVRHTPGAVNVENLVKQDRTDIHFRINKEKALALGVPVVEIDRTIRTAVNGRTVTYFRDAEGKEYPVVLRMPQGDTLRLSDMDLLFVHSLSGRAVPLPVVAEPEFRTDPGIITRYNLQRSILITADLAKGYTLDDVMKPVEKQMEKMDFPFGYGYRIAGELENRRESFGGMGEAAVIALIAIFAVLVLQFGSFKQPLIIFVAIPLAVTGSLWALFLTGYTFSFMAFVGLVSLVGIVVNNSIILVDQSNRLRKEGISVTQAVVRAGKIRFTPIILTALTTIGGLLPLTLKGGLIWAPMGWTIIGGLLVSTLLTLIIVPLLYLLLSK